MGECYPKYNRNYQTMNSIERKEYQRLNKLVKFQDNIPEFLRKELSLDIQASADPIQS